MHKILYSFIKAGDIGIKNRSLQLCTIFFIILFQAPVLIKNISKFLLFTEQSRTHSDSDSDNSGDGRSLELASSHSSDDDISSRHHSTIKSMGNLNTYSSSPITMTALPYF